MQNLQLLEEHLFRGRHDHLGDVCQGIGREHCVCSEGMGPTRPPACSCRARAKCRHANVVLEQILLHALSKTVDGEFRRGIDAVAIHRARNAAYCGHGGNVQYVSAAVLFEEWNGLSDRVDGALEIDIDGIVNSLKYAVAVRTGGSMQFHLG